jgi:hypothetical protein
MDVWRAIDNEESRHAIGDLTIYSLQNSIILPYLLFA